MSQHKQKLENFGGSLIDLKNIYDSVNDTSNERTETIKTIPVEEESTTKIVNLQQLSRMPSSGNLLSQEPKQERKLNLKNTGLNGVGFAVAQRPSNRNDIIALGNELEDKLKSKAAKTHLKGYLDCLYDEHRKDNGWKKHILNAFIINYSCGATTSDMVELLTVNSADMGNLLRKVKKMESKSTDEMVLGVNLLFENLVATESKLRETEDKLHQQIEKMKTLEKDVADQSRKRISDLESALKDSILREDEIKRKYQHDMDERNQKLKSLTNELEITSTQLLKTETTKDSLAASYGQLAASYRKLELTLESKIDEINSLKIDMEQRDEVLSDLMEKEALRSAEIKKLSNLVTLETPLAGAGGTSSSSADSSSIPKEHTSLFCVRCQSQLEDISSIEDAVFGRGARNANRLYCESFRLLLSLESSPLPVVRQSAEWLRQVMRCILQDRLKRSEAIATVTAMISKSTNTSQNITEFGSVSSAVFSQCSGRFFQYVYNYFDHNINTEGGWQLTDRLSFYTGIRGFVMEGNNLIYFHYSNLDSKLKSYVHGCCLYL